MTAARTFAIVLAIDGARAQAEEVLQEVCLKVRNESARFDATKGAVGVWLTAIARYGAIDSLRRRRGQPGQPGLSSIDAAADADDGYDGIDSAAHGPLETVILRQGVRATWLLMESLPCRQRQSLMLACPAGLSHAEIACRLGRPLGSVKSALRRGLETLRPALAACR